MMEGSWFTVKSQTKKGDVLIASKDALPGQTILEEKPLLYCPEEFTGQFDSFNEITLCKVAYAVFCEDDWSEEKERYLSLFSPTTGPFGETLRSVGVSMDIEDVELFAKVASVCRFNISMIEHSDVTGFGIYETSSKVSHSCLPNCVKVFSGNVCRLQTILPVKAGEELTVDYINKASHFPTHVRRHVYLSRQEFTCHCPRCDALGDTRQFNCFDSKCNGVHLASQPINQEPMQCFASVPEEELLYTGVTFSEPYFLACSECGRPAPLDYQAEMLAFEQRMKVESKEFFQEYSALVMPGDWGFLAPTDQQCREMIQKAKNLNFPARHSIAFEVLSSVATLSLFLTSEPENDWKLRLNAARELITNAETFMKVPTHLLSDTLYLVGRSYVICAPHLSEEQILEGFRYLQRGIRTFLLVSAGRHKRHENLENSILSLANMYREKFQRNFPVVAGTCYHCGESEAHAAIKLLKCGKCGVATYCGAGCQKVHWKLHKLGCKKA